LIGTSIGETKEEFRRVGHGAVYKMPVNVVGVSVCHGLVGCVNVKIQVTGCAYFVVAFVHDNGVKGKLGLTVDLEPVEFGVEAVQIFGREDVDAPPTIGNVVLELETIQTDPNHTRRVEENGRSIGGGSTDGIKPLELAKAGLTSERVVGAVPDKIFFGAFYLGYRHAEYHHAGYHHPGHLTDASFFFFFFLASLQTSTWGGGKNVMCAWKKSKNPRPTK